MLILLLNPIRQRLIVQKRTAVVPGLMVVRMIFVQPARVPTKTALEDDTTSETNSASVFSSFLKLPAALATANTRVAVSPLEVAPAITGVTPLLLLLL